VVVVAREGKYHRCMEEVLELCMLEAGFPIPILRMEKSEEKREVEKYSEEIKHRGLGKKVLLKGRKLLNQFLLVLVLTSSLYSNFQL